MKQYDLKAFLESFVIPDLRKMIDLELHYYAFSVICQGIEVMGSVYDQHDIDDPNLSKNRFNNAVSNLFGDRRYREKQHLFYSVLRGPLIHQLRPGPNLLISSARKDGINPANHLTKHESETTVLVIEQFYEDFVGAFENFKKELARRSDLDRRKAEQPFIQISTYNPAHPTKWWDSEKGTPLTLTPSVTGRAIVD